MKNMGTLSQTFLFKKNKPQNVEDKT
jgi:hypothetical protein